MKKEKEFSTGKSTAAVIRKVALLNALTEKRVKLPDQLSGKQLDEIFQQAIEAGISVPYSQFDDLSAGEKTKFLRSLDGFVPKGIKVELRESDLVPPEYFTPEQQEIWKTSQMYKNGYHLNFHNKWVKD